MQEPATRSEIEGLIESFLGRAVGETVETGGSFLDPDPRGWRLNALLLLAAHHFPIERMPLILRCSAEEVELALDALAEHLPDPASILRFLDGERRGEPAGHGGVAVSASAEKALDTLHYWTDKWFDGDDVEVERTRGEPELSP